MQEFPKFEKREALKALTTKLVNENTEEGKSPNSLLNMYYRTQDLKIRSLHTWEQWKSLGFNIIAGSKGYPFWSAPVEKTNANGEPYKYFPINYWFSDLQITKINK